MTHRLWSSTAKVPGSLAWALTNSLVMRAGNLAVGIVVVRLLSPKDFGTFAVGLTVLTILAAIAELGLTADLVRKGDVRRRAPTVTTVGTAVSVSLALLVFSLAPFVAPALGSAEATEVIQVLALTLPISGLSAVPMAVLQLRFEQRRQFAADLTSFIVGTVATIVMLLMGMGAMSLAWSRVLAQLATWILLMVLARTPVKFGFDRVVARELLSFGVPLCGANVLSWLLLNVDYLLIGHVQGATNLGLYVLAFNIASWPTSALTQAVRAIALPAFADTTRTADPTALRLSKQSSALTMSTALTWWGAVPMATMIAALASPLIVVLYGERWSSAASALVALAAFGAMRTVFDVWATLLIALGATRQVLLIQVLWTAALIPTLLLGLMLDGIKGAAWVHVLVAGLVVLPAYLIALRSQHISVAPLGRQVMPTTMFGILAGAVAWAIGNWISLPLASLIVAGAAGTLVYLACTGRWVRNSLIKWATERQNLSRSHSEWTRLDAPEPELTTLGTPGSSEVGADDHLIREAG